jgi:hypothetical protein
MKNEKLIALWETVKLPLRIIILAVLPFLVAYLTEVNYEWAGVMTSILVFLDKYLHELWKIEEDKDLKRENEKPVGIIPF